MKTILSALLLISIIACERINDPVTTVVYRGTITYSLPSINETTPASRTFRNDSVVWWQAPNVSGQCIVNSNCYQVNGITIFASSSCVDSIAIVHTGTGEFIPDSLIESGTVVYYRRSGTIEETEVGTYIFRGAKVPNHNN